MHGRIRKEQREYAKVLTEHGGLYFIVRSLESAQNAISQALGFTPDKKVAPCW